MCFRIPSRPVGGIDDSIGGHQQGERVYNFGTLSPGYAEREGVSVFSKDDSGEVFHTYSSYVPTGPDEEGRAPQYWVRRHDEYTA